MGLVPKLMGAWEIAQRLGVSRQRAYVIIMRRDFPEPVVELRLGKIWLAQDVELWIAEHRPHLDAPDEP